MKSDAELQEDVIEALEWEPSIDVAQLGVTVKGGVVTLAGSVSSMAERLDAERAAQRVHGVKALAVKIEVKTPGGRRRDDAGLRQWT